MKIEKDLITLWEDMMNHIPKSDELARTALCDKNTSHTYLPIYDKVFRKILTGKNSINLMEIGIKTGGSIYLWKQYLDQFTINNTVFGIDIEPIFFPIHRYKDRSVWYNNPDPHFHSTHQYLLAHDKVKLFFEIDSTKLNSIPREVRENSFDIIVDDGAHEAHNQFLTFCCYWDRIKPGGVFCIEDVRVDEEKVLVPALKTWLKHNNQKYIFSQYHGKLSKRKDDYIIFITKVE